MTNAILNHLKSVRCSTLASNDVIRIKPTDSLEQVVTSLLANKLVSAPIVDKDDLVVGIFDVNELISFLVLTSGVFKRAEGEFTTYYVGSAFDTTSPKAIVSSRSSTVMAVMDAAYYSSYLVPIDPAEHVSSKLEHFSEGVHRAPLTVERRLAGWLSQVDIVTEILKAVRCNESCRHMAQKSLEFFGLGKQAKIFTVSSRHSLGDVVEMFNDYQLAAFPVVEENGALGGNFSMTNVLALWTG
jgi:CBS-domain-containing membrane protein